MSAHSADPLGIPAIRTTSWQIDPARSKLEFRAKTFWGLVTVKGHFSRYQGTLDLAGEPTVELTIEAESLDTKNRKRDGHLRSPDFFNVAKHPSIRFVSESATLSGDVLKVRGHLHARGTRMPLEFEATLRRVGDELKIEASTDADHHQLGMTWNRLGMMRSPSQLLVEGRLLRVAA